MLKNQRQEQEHHENKTKQISSIIGITKNHLQYIQ